MFIDVYSVQHPEKQFPYRPFTYKGSEGPQGLGLGLRRLSRVRVRAQGVLQGL